MSSSVKRRGGFLSLFQQRHDGGAIRSRLSISDRKTSDPQHALSLPPSNDTLVLDNNDVTASYKSLTSKTYGNPLCPKSDGVYVSFSKT